jgi:hypothetical protein
VEGNSVFEEDGADASKQERASGGISGPKKGVVDNILTADGRDENILTADGRDKVGVTGGEEG